MQRIGIVRGGVSPEYDISLATGENVRRALSEAGYEAIDMLLDKDGVLHIKGIPADFEKTQASVDMVWNALHGTFGEDGQLQSMLESYGIPYAGSGTLASALAFNKSRAKEIATGLGIKTPQSMLIMPDGSESVSEVTQRIYKTMAPPWVIKPLSGGGSIRTYFAFTALELAPIVEESITHGESFIVEQYIEGREAAVGVIEEFRNREEYVLPVVEVQSPKRGILAHDIRRAPEKEYAVAGGGFTPIERETLSHYAKELHHAFGASDYSQSEFIIDNHGRVWFTEIDTHPHMTDQSPFLVALQAVGSTLTEFVASVLKK